MHCKRGNCVNTQKTTILFVGIVRTVKEVIVLTTKKTTVILFVGVVKEKIGLIHRKQPYFLKVSYALKKK